ncbi:PLP-dependent aminotransferase family protein [Streptococcus halichoeri]|uniref:aminotransferase-like domain-containing protein n=1 Tax=Streptococcus halichoeri TaxID=254785 RepID=UPI001F430F9C|nr:PLP-dependent aminotransferase family protein [Streptococcus halichoeri]
MTKYQAIISAITTAIEQEHYQTGQRIPSIRQLSRDYHCSKDTVQRALHSLVQANIIYAVPKSGYYVFGDQGQVPNPGIQHLADYHHKAYQDFQRCLTESFDKDEHLALNDYPNQAGLPELIESLQPYLQDKKVYTKPDHILITSGSQQALYLLSQIQFPNQGSHILIDKPSYSGMVNILKQLALPFETIEREADHYDFTALEALFKQGHIKYYYTIPHFSNPLGLSYKEAEKKRLVALAERYNVYLLEDDYLGDFSPGSLPLHYYDTAQRVIYLQSFSMTLFPALRLAALVLPANLVAAVLNYKKVMDLGTNSMIQKALALYLSNGMFTRNNLSLKHYLAERQQFISQSLTQLPPQISYHLTPRQLILRQALSTRAYFLEVELAAISTKLTTRYANYYSLALQDLNLEQLLEILQKK